jgi:hypothetical protein
MQVTSSGPFGNDFGGGTIDLTCDDIYAPFITLSVMEPV